MATLEPLDNNRYQMWISFSHAVAKIEPFMVPIVQGLGRLDAWLVFESERYGSLPTEVRTTAAESIALNDRITLSYLWVLGAYELIRSIDQRKGIVRGFSDAVKQLIGETKMYFNRVRVPLAKMEPAHQFKDSDGRIAYPYNHDSLGAAWRVSKTTVIARIDLSDHLLELLEEIHHTGLSPDRGFGTESQSGKAD